MGAMAHPPAMALDTAHPHTAQATAAMAHPHTAATEAMAHPHTALAAAMAMATKRWLVHDQTMESRRSLETTDISLGNSPPNSIPTFVLRVGRSQWLHSRSCDTT